MFGPDSPWQRELEDNFTYVETPDQMVAIIEVKRDMEQIVPMDRLICGDEGYGKTEIAVRAAFKAVQDGKPLYDSVRYYGGDYMLTKKDRLSGIVDMTGQEIVPPMYDALGGGYAVLACGGGYQAALEGGKLRFLTRDGQVSA